MSKLNIHTFNEVLLKYCKNDDSRIELLENELTIVADILWDEVAALLQELEDIDYNSEQFTKIKTIKHNTEHIIEMLEELEAKRDAKQEDTDGQTR